MSKPFVIGIIGGGQLARMMYQASISLGMRIRLLTEDADSSAAQVIRDITVGDWRDTETVRDFARSCDAITFDHEHVPTQLLRTLEAEGVKVRPSPDALQYAQDKRLMRERLSTLSMPCPQWRACSNAETLIAFGDETGWPIIAKASRGGYDGHGVWKIDGPADAATPFIGLRSHSAGERVEIIGEEFIDFDRELSALAVRSANGDAVVYPVSETVQIDGMCRATITPAPGLAPAIASEAQDLALSLANHLGVVGMLAVELMQRHDGSLIVNELAMRPHNTGHWSIDGAHTSQFENHLRAVSGLPLGDANARSSWTVMRNVLGSNAQTAEALQEALAADRRLRIHFYGKEIRLGRKLAHVTAYGDDLSEVDARALQAANRLMGVDDD